MITLTGVIQVRVAILWLPTATPHDVGVKYAGPGRPQTAIGADNGWFADSIWDYRPDVDRDTYVAVASKYVDRLLRTPPTARRKLEQIAIRCPLKGCLLATIYEFPIFRTAEELAAGNHGGTYYLYVGRRPAGNQSWDILNFYCACDQILYQRAACRCGTCLLYTSPSPRDGLLSRMPSSA